MKTIKKSAQFLEDCKTKFLQYLDNLKDGENINFKYDADTDIENIIKPKIIISKEAKNKMDTLIKKAEGEKFCSFKKLLYLCNGKRKQTHNKSITLKKTLS